jgi:6,7-dimethyl-8-ribityllumazine synthase
MQPQASLAPKTCVGIVYSSFYADIVSQMVQEAQLILERAGVLKSNILLQPAPGSFEVPLLGAALAKEGKVDALIGLGIIVRGETAHADLLASAVSKGMMDVQLQFGIPFAFEVLFVEDVEQAKERARSPGGKGAEAAHAVIESLLALKNILPPTSIRRRLVE